MHDWIGKVRRLFLNDQQITQASTDNNCLPQGDTHRIFPEHARSSFQTHISFRSRLTAFTALVLSPALLFTLSACSQSAISLRVGDCFTAPETVLVGEEPLTAVEVIPCTKSHNSEVVGIKILKDGPFPQQAELSKITKDFCMKSFEEYVGTQLPDSEYELYPVAPSEYSWDKAHDRVITCVALTLPSRTSSVKGTQK